MKPGRRPGGGKGDRVERANGWNGRGAVDDAFPALGEESGRGKRSFTPFCPPWCVRRGGVSSHDTVGLTEALELVSI